VAQVRSSARGGHAAALAVSSAHDERDIEDADKIVASF
jgi:hypothetical protein